jgi:CRISPR-associated Csx3 family protein
MAEKIFIPEAQAPQEFKEGEPKIEKLSINDFAREIGLQPDAQGRFTFGPEHVRLAYEYAEKFARDKKAEKVVIDGIASPGVIASLLHGVHPAEGYLSYMQKDAEGKMVKGEIKILEPLPQGEGRGPEGFTWSKKETPDYTLVEFALSGDFKPDDLDKVIPPDVDPSKPVIISGRGPLYLTHTIAAGYRHYKGVPAVGFYQPASKFGPAKTEIGISHSEEYPLGLNFGEPAEIDSAKEQYEKRIAENLTKIKEGIEGGQVSAVEVSGKTIKITLASGESYLVSVRDVRKGE